MSKFAFLNGETIVYQEYRVYICLEKHRHLNELVVGDKCYLMSDDFWSYELKKEPSDTISVGVDGVEYIPMGYVNESPYASNVWVDYDTVTWKHHHTVKAHEHSECRFYVLDKVPEPTMREIAIDMMDHMRVWDQTPEGIAAARRMYVRSPEP